MMAAIRKYMLPLILLLAACAAQGQTIDQWREIMLRYQEENRIIDGYLKDTRKERQTTESQLKMTLVRIDNSRKIVTSLDRQISERNRRIGILNGRIRGLEGDQKKLRAEYADMVYAAYKNYKLNNFLLFLFASDDFNDATKRVYFMRRYNQHREDKAAQLKGVSDSLAVLVTSLGGELADLDKTKQTRTSELSSLRKVEKEHRVVADELKKKERTLSSEKKAKEQQIAAAKQKIADLIAAEARKARSETLSDTQVQYNIQLTGRFDQNKGKLPYPVGKGVIIESFGSSADGKLKNPNKGVKIAATAGSQVNCVFEGTVTSVFALPGMNNGIIVRHGNYFTVYTNLTTVSVKMGDKVALNQKLGTIPAGGDSDNHYLHFEICRLNTSGDPATHLNPALWLHR